jgi:hypothetical protein
VFTLLGQFTEAEVRSAAGPEDAVVKTKDRIYVFEFKLEGKGSAKEAIKQIDEKGYLIPYTADGRRLVKAGVVFDGEKRTISAYQCPPPPLPKNSHLISFMYQKRAYYDIFQF